MTGPDGVAYWARCEGCGASIAWTTGLYSAAPLAVNWAPDPGGLVGVRDVGGRLVSRVLRQGDHLRPGELGATPHASTCTAPARKVVAG